MNEDDATYVRFAPESLKDYHDITEGVRVCEHIRIANAFEDSNTSCEYMSTVELYCVVCDEMYELREKIN